MNKLNKIHRKQNLQLNMDSNYSLKQDGNVLKTCFQNIIKLSLVFFLMFSVNTLKGQTIPPTNAPRCLACVPPGWTIVSGTTDVSDTTSPGYSSSFFYDLAPIPTPPTTGHSTFMDGIGGEAASTTITGLTNGDAYSLVFDYGFWIVDNRTVANNDPNYNITVDIDGTVTVLNLQNVNTWYIANINFIATGATATITITYNSLNNYSVWNASISANSIIACNAGTNTPTLSATTLSNVCPVTTADLTSITASNTPAGTSLTWHTATPATTANLVASSNSVPAGTYYAAFYDATNDCYSGTTSGTATTSVVVTITNCCNAGINPPKF
jgi:hypothetical protein